MSIRGPIIRRCPRSGRVIGLGPVEGWPRWLFVVVGSVSLIWLLVRVVPRPSRSAYPCQRIAAPMAGCFILWLLGLAVSAYAYSIGKVHVLKSRWSKAVLFALVAVIGCFVAITNLPRPALVADPLRPLGVAKGIHPGRVVWVWNTGATNWPGPGSGKRYYEPACTDVNVCQRMVSQAVRGLTGEDSDAAAWDALFRSYNTARGRGDVGYRPGEKVMIKINLTTCNARGGQVDRTTYDKLAPLLDRVDNSPQLMLVLLHQLVNFAGVAESDITIGDATGLFPNNLHQPLWWGFRNVKYMDNYGGSGRTREEFSAKPFYWSTPAADSKRRDYVPVSYADATYVVNFAVLKGHSSGVSNCGKNSYGSLLRCPDGYLRDQGMLDYYDLHLSLPNAVWSPGTGKYRAVVDLMGSDEIGGKTVLYLIDGLYGGYYWECNPVRWQMPPFNNDWPSSLFASQDPVAIDSVAYDFLATEWPNVVSGGDGAPGSLQGGAEDYLREAALADNPPSGTFYDPERDGVRMRSLGVHEHWNNPIDKQYSRNLGLGMGIELVKLTEDQGAIGRAKQKGNSQTVVVAGATVSAAFDGHFYIESDDRTMGLRVDKASHGVSAGMRVNVYGPALTNSHGERFISATTVSDAGSGSVLPVYALQRNLGGGDWNYNPATGAGQRMVTGGTGLNNIGLLMRVSGVVTLRDSSQTPTWFAINDGSLAGAGVKCVVPPGSAVPSVGSFTRVTGISSCEKDGLGAIHRLVKVVSVD